MKEVANLGQEYTCFVKTKLPRAAFLCSFDHGFHLAHLVTDIIGPRAAGFHFKVILPGHDGRLEVSLVMEVDDAQIVAAVNVLGISFRGFLKLFNGSIKISFSPVHNTHIGTDIGVLGINGQSPGIGFYGFIELGAIEIGIAQFNEGF